MCIFTYSLDLFLDGSIRDKAVKSACRWVVQNCTHLDKLKFNKLWKGLFYSTFSISMLQHCVSNETVLALWMADRPSYQSRLAQRLADIWLELDEINEDASHFYAHAFWSTICREWNGIDRFRLDKYYALVRAFLIAAFGIMRKNRWCPQVIDRIGLLWREFVLNPNSCLEVPDALRIYALENFVALYKEACLGFKLDEEQCIKLLDPYIVLAAHTTKPSVFKAAKIFLESLAGLEDFLELQAVGRKIFSAGESGEIRTTNRSILYATGQRLQRL